MAHGFVLEVAARASAFSLPRDTDNLRYADRFPAYAARAGAGNASPNFRGKA